MASMERRPNPEIIAVERLRDGVMVKFADGSCVFYSAKFLYEAMPQAQAQNEELAAW